MSEGSPDLKRGVTLADFHTEGIEPVDSDKLNKSESGYIITWAAILTNLHSNPSGPALLSSFNSHIALNTSVGKMF